MADFPTPRLFDAPAREIPLEFLEELTPQKLEERGYRVVKISLSYLQPFLYESPMWQTDGRYSALSILYSILGLNLY